MSPTIARLTLHHFPATRSARVRWMLHEVVGDDFDLVGVDLYAGAQYRPDFMALNPNHAVPVLEIAWSDGTVQTMIESGAIVAFLADAYPEKALAPPAAANRERADYLQILQFGATWIDMMLWQIRIHEHVLPQAERDERTVARYRGKFQKEVEPQLAARLAAAPYICGERFTAADCVIGHDVTWARGYGMCQDEVFRSYLSRVSKRPAFAAAFADARQFKAEVPKDKAEAGRFSG
jgi:glutathione S-transferase